MGFLGRGRGSGSTVKRTGGIHASSRKPNNSDSGGSKRDQREHHGSGHNRDRASRSSSRGDSRRSRDRSRSRSRSPLKSQFTKDISATESLRITVGNDNYKEKSRSPLAGRLGPPVDRSPFDDQRKLDRGPLYGDHDSYDQEAKYYRQGDRGWEHDRDQQSGRNGSYQGERDRDFRSDRYDNREKDFYQDRRGSNDGYSGPEDLYQRRNDEREGSIDRRENRSRDSLERHSNYRDATDESFYRDTDMRGEKSKDIVRGSMDGYGNSSIRETYKSTNMDLANETRQTIPLLPAAQKPLKSILKKKSVVPEEKLPAQAINPPEGAGQNLFPIMCPQINSDRFVSSSQESRTDFPPVTLDNHSSRQESRGGSRGGLPGMSSYMDIEDEEKFLYGDDDHEPEKVNLMKGDIQRSSLSESGERLHNDHYGSREERLPRHDSYSLEDVFKTHPYDQQQSHQEFHLDDDLRKRSLHLGHLHGGPTSKAEMHSSVTSFLEDERFRYTSQQEQNLFAARDTKPVLEESSFKPDLLSMFTASKETISQPPPAAPPVQYPKEEPKQNYDPTIENILKSIGFDFEMSRRMQEKASNTQPVQKPKKDEQQFGINQTASFLEGGLSDDIKNKLFKKKEESIVDILIREAKEGPTKPVERRHEWEDVSIDRYIRKERSSVEKDRRADIYNQERDSDFRDKKRDQDSELRDKKRDRDIEHREKKRDRDSDLREKKRERDHRDKKRDSYIDVNERERKRDPVPPNDESHNTSDPFVDLDNSESLSSGISFQRQPAVSNTNFPVISQPVSYQHPSFQPNMDPYTAAPMSVPPQVLPANAGTMPPYQGPPMDMYQPPPPYGYRQPPPGYASGPFPPNYNFPPGPGNPYAQPCGPRHQSLPPPGTIPLENRTKTLRAVPVDQSKPTKEQKEEVLEKKTITIEKKTITIAGNNFKETNRTVIPPRLDKSKSVDQNVDSKESVKRPREESPKVLTAKEREKLLKEKEERRQRIEALETELQKLRKQQNEMMRKKRRQKDGHKDPVLLQNSKLQDEISMQISKLRKASEENSKILKEANVESGASEAKKPKEDEKKEVKTETKSDSKTPKKKKGEQLVRKKRYEFFDPGGHWCKVCHTESGSIYSVLQHLHGKKHQQAMNAYDRPWVPRAMKSSSKPLSSDHVAVLPVKGQEFLVPCKAFYCTLCKEFAGDEACADFHLKSDTHYQNYLKHLEQNEFYEQRMGLDRAAGMSSTKKSIKKEEVKREERNEEKRQRVQEKEKKWGKPVEELDFVDKRLKAPPSTAKEPRTPQSASNESKAPKVVSDGFGKFTFEDKSKKDSSEIKTLEETEKKDEKDNTVFATGDAGPDSKSKIAINITSKMSIKPITGVKIPVKKNPLLPPWTPVSKQDGQKQTPGSSKVEAFPLRKGTGKTEAGGGKTSSLDMFLTIDDKSKPLPVMKDGSGKPKVTAQDILKAFSGKLKDDNTGTPEEKCIKTNEEKEINKDKKELEDLKMLSIDPNDDKPLAEKKAPPPPSQNLLLPANMKKNNEDVSSRSDPSANTEEQKDVISIPKESLDLENIELPPTTSGITDTVTSSGQPAESKDMDTSLIESDIEDGGSECSGFSMHMGSDFEVVDECEAD